MCPLCSNCYFTFASDGKHNHMTTMWPHQTNSPSTQDQAHSWESGPNIISRDDVQHVTFVWLIPAHHSNTSTCSINRFILNLIKRDLNVWYRTDWHSKVLKHWYISDNTLQVCNIYTSIKYTYMSIQSYKRAMLIWKLIPDLGIFADVRTKAQWWPPMGELEPLLIPNQCWDTISVDFIVELLEALCGNLLKSTINKLIKTI